MQNLLHNYISTTRSFKYRCPKILKHTLRHDKPSYNLWKVNDTEASERERVLINLVSFHMPSYTIPQSKGFFVMDSGTSMVPKGIRSSRFQCIILFLYLTIYVMPHHLKQNKILTVVREMVLPHFLVRYNKHSDSTPHKNAIISATNF